MNLLGAFFYRQHLLDNTIEIDDENSWSEGTIKIKRKEFVSVVFLKKSTFILSSVETGIQYRFSVREYCQPCIANKLR